MYEAMKEAAVSMPPDVTAALHRIRDEEITPLARQHIAVSLKNAEYAAQGQGLVCGDTGYPLYFVKIGRDCDIRGGLRTIHSAAERAVDRATRSSFLRPTMVDPLTRDNPGSNIGPGMPRVKVTYDDSFAGMRIVAAPKGGGSEIFGTFYRMLVPADGIAGVKKFVMDAVRSGCYAGKICPPAIVGVGIGGTADLCMEIAKTAALLRPVGSVSARQDAAELERDLTAASRRLGIGPMGSRGINAVMCVHVETAVTHTAALPVAVNAQCLIGRRWLALVAPDGSYELTGDISQWSGGP